ncbi:TonB-dependent receptor [uncultured Parabacteroides sp.]|uniref:TonB-dependent receptor n=1 Tax=uncultured Parabacteroides sp. TaxID=512312 RepID=UPI002630EF0B|nr:TonB-dependent receptor [uncultured Parabacteroides sp.]
MTNYFSIQYFRVVKSPFAILKKIPLFMRLSILMLFVSIGLVFAENSYSQSTLLSLDIKNQTVQNVLDEIEKQSDFHFFYNNKQVNTSRIVSIKSSNKNVFSILEELFKGTDIRYSVMEKSIILSIESKNDVTQQSSDKTISGIVTDINKEPIIGANVSVKGTTIGTITDVDGHYSLPGVPEKAILVFSFVGMKAQEIIVNNKTTINISLEETAIGLGEVVAIGYGTTKKATITGSIASMKGDKLKSIPANNFTNALAGKFAGLTAVTTSGQPGSDNSTLRIRGSNTLGDNNPLVVVDGIAGRDMNRLNPADVESITVLKDASAAIYGAQAANGVILVTTKRGVIGKPVINVNVRQGWATPTIVPEWADAATYAQALNEIDSYANRQPRYTDDDIRMFRDGSDPWGHPNTDWYDLIFKRFTPQTYVDASLRGGSDKVKYFVSAGFNYQKGIFQRSANSYRQMDIRSNLDAKVTKYVNLGIDLAARQENRNNSTAALSELLRYGMGRPNRVAFYGEYPASGYEGGMNPAVVATNATGYDHNISYILTSNAKLDITIPGIEGLTVTGNVAFDKYIRNQKTWKTPWTLYSWDGKTLDANNMPVVSGASSGYSSPSLNQYMQDDHGLTLNALINYSHTFGEAHGLKAMVGIERKTGESMNFSAYRTYFASTLIDELFAGGDLDKTNTGSASHDARINYFGRFNYDYLSKYLVEFVFRYDGSYIFPKRKQYGFFPSISLGWVISEENFWKEKLSFINSFKLRGSWGQTGNDRVSPYQYLASYGFDNSAAGNMHSPKDSKNTTVFDGNTEAKFLKELRIPNPSITWEVANQGNIGFDLQTLNGNLRISADYFHNIRSNILCYRNASIPATAGLTLPRENIGKVKNQGFEFDITYNNNIGDFTYQIGLNGGFSKSKIIFWDESPNVPDYQRATGKPINPSLISDNSAGLYYEAIGIFKDEADIEKYPHWQGAKPGDIIFKDVNNDGKIDGLDRVRSDKTNIPTLTGGLNIDLGYKDFYLTLGFQGAAGATRYHEVESGEAGNFSMEDLKDRWTPTNTSASKPRVGNYRSEYWNQTQTGPNTYWNRKSDYIRLKNLEFGYNMPQKFYHKLGIESARIYFSGMNLFTICGMKTFDPETTSAVAYPLNKIYSIGLALTF